VCGSRWLLFKTNDATSGIIARADSARYSFVRYGYSVEWRCGWRALADGFSWEIVPLMDLKLSLEYGDVALRPEHLAASALSKREVVELIEALEAFAEPVEIVLKTRPMSPDQNDDMVLDLAINGRAEALVTNNTRHFVEGEGASEYRCSPRRS
jgi:hypothetical protein